MAEERVQRRLAAILAADVVGYSRLMGEDETGTLSALKQHRAALIDQTIAEHRGRIVKLMGDGVLVEFASVVDAVECAGGIQRGMVERNAGIPESNQITFRIGVNLGDIIIDDDDIYGDGVNIAARLEGLAEPGGICVSAKVFEEVGNKLDVSFEDLGPQEVKNIAEPVRAYRVRLDSGNSPEISLPQVRQRRPVVVGGIVVVAAALIAGGLYTWFERSQSDQTNEATLPSAVAAVEADNPDEQASAQPDKPSIAVLAFQNMSDDPNQEYFADGMAEDLITDLSKVSALFVTARNSSFQYKGQAVDIKKIGHELGVRYVVEGSVRRAGNQVRITAQLIDAETGGHVWAERYDGSLDDVFALQDRVTGQIIESLRLQLTPSERLAVETHGTNETTAYDAYLRGLNLLAELKRIDVDANRAARAEFEEAVRIDPNYALAIAGIAWSEWLAFSTIHYFAGKTDAFELAEKSIALSDNALAHRVLSKRHFTLQGEFVFANRKPDLAVAELEAARRLQPNDPDILADLSAALSFSGQPQKALSLIQKAMELNPNHPEWYLGVSGIALLLTGDSKRASEHLQAWSDISPSWRVPYIFLAAALANSGDIDGAKSAVHRYGELYGPGTRTTILGVQNKWPMASEQQELFNSALRLAGVN
jgi:TolB-like protein/class 3 adenylate cyclase/Flp pilus assembly protein TadD